MTKISAWQPCDQCTDPMDCGSWRACHNKRTHPVLTQQDVVAYKLTLKALTPDQLFEAWSHEYDAKHTEHVTLIIAEMDMRNTVGVINL
jgi:hypothetical protein